MKKLYIFDAGNVVLVDINVLVPAAQALGIKDVDAFKADYAKYDFPLMDGSVSWEAYWSHVEALFSVKAPRTNLFLDLFHPRYNKLVTDKIADLRKQGCKVALGTNTFDIHWNYMTGVMHIDDLFDGCYASHLMRVTKPDFRFYEMILQDQGVDARDAFFFDDLKANIEGARKGGLDGLVYTDEAFKAYWGL